MKCPFCGTEMKYGYLHTGMALWSEKKHRLTLNPAEDEFYALKLGKPLLSPHQVESNYCPRCEKIILDCSGYEKSTS